MINGHEINGAEINGSGVTAILETLAEGVDLATVAAPLWAHILIERLVGAETLTPGTVYDRVFSESAEFLDTPQWAWAYTATEGLELADAPVAVQAVLLLEALGLTETLTPATTFAATVAESTALTDQIVRALGVAIAEQLELSPAVSALWGALLVEGIAAGDAIVGNRVLTPALAEALSFADLLARFIAGSLSETLELSPTVTRSMLYSPVITAGVDFSDTATRVLLAASTASETLELTGVEALQALYSPTLAEELEITLVAVNPSGGVTTWAVNASTGAVSRYDNYEFNSFAEMYPHYLGASDTGLYELDGDTDAGASIIPTLRSGFAQFAGVRLASLDAAYIGVRGDGDFVLKVITADGQSYSYAATAASMQTVRVSLGRGLKARYIAFELVGDGSDFDLESIEFHPLAMGRRV